MTATLDRPTKPTTVTDDPAVKAAAAKLAEIRARHKAADDRLVRLQSRPPSQDASDRAAAILSGTELQNVLDDREKLASEVRDLAAAAELAESRHRLAIHHAANRIRESCRAELTENITAVVDAVAQVFGALEDFGQHLESMAARGAAIPADEYVGVLTVPGMAGGFRLPLPGTAGSQVETIRRHYAEHIRKAFGAQVAESLES
jgi:hypothetical protein